LYVRKWINIEGIAKLKYCKAVPFVGLDWSEMRDQMNATNDGLDSNNTGRPLPILYFSGHPIHTMFGIGCCWDWGEPFDICEVLWGQVN